MSPAAERISSGWTISADAETLFTDADFGKAGTLKANRTIYLSKILPATFDQCICFTTIGFTVNALIDGRSVYAFGSALEGADVWGVKTHLLQIPDGAAGRTIKLLLVSNSPRNTAISKYVLLDGEAAILSALLKSNMPELVFSLFYISIGVFILLFVLISAAFQFRSHDITLLALAFIALLMGGKILLSLSMVSFLVGPEAVYWIVSVADLAIPICTLVFVAADKGFQDCRPLLVMSAAQTVALCAWLLGNLFNFELYLSYWHIPLTVALAAVVAATLAREFKRGVGRPEVAAAIGLILLASLADACRYFTDGDYYALGHNLTIATFPVLVLITGKVALSMVQKENRILSENMALRLEGELLYRNYRQTERYMEQTRLIWHDIDKHLAVVSRLLGSGEYAELQLYLEQAGHGIRLTKNAHLCENSLVNAILTDKLEEAQAKGISMTCSGDLPARLRIPGTDLCSLLVNMLDNAIEACDRMPVDSEKRIAVALGQKGDFVHFTVSNSFAGVPPMQADELVTSKADKEGHGYGISIIKQIARRYDGAFEITPAASSFLVRVALRNR